KLSTRDSMLVTLIIGLSNFILLPTGGICSDKFGRRRMLAIFSALALVSAYPVLLWLVKDPSFGRLVAVGLWFSILFGGYNGSMVVFLVEAMPAKVRASGFSLAFALAAGIFGGFTPLVSTYLIHVTGDRAIPGLWLSFAALMGLIATAALSPRSKAIQLAAATTTGPR
ncbi:MAG: MFS transporter, partial [Acidobacteriota bacterium]|nr:MFS transporter [Acidobacteriota bacterium]